MAVTFDKVVSANETGGTDTATTGAIAPAGTDRYMLVGVAIEFAQDVQTVKKGTTDFTFVTAIEDAVGSPRVELWELKNPSTTSETVVVVLDAADDGFTVGAMSFAGVDQTTPLQTTVTASGNGDPTDVIASSVDNMIAFVFSIFRDLNFSAVGTGAIEQWDLSGGRPSGGGITYPGATSVTATANYAQSRPWVSIGVSIAAAAGGGAFEIDAAAGSVLVTGTIATLEQGYQISADASSVAITFTDIGLEFGYSIAADSSSYLIQGTAADLERSYQLPADSGSISIVGTPATLHRAIPFAADSGSVLISGTETTFELGLQIDAAPGAVSITGTPATFESGVQLQAAAGSVLASGTEATFELGYQIPAVAGSVLITGTEATLTKSGIDPILPADPGSIDITGTPATLYKGYEILAEAAAGTVGRETVATPFGGAQNNSTSVDCGTNDNRFLVVHAVWFTGVVTLDTITFDGVNMTLIESHSDTANNVSAFYGLVNPPTGSSTLVANFSALPGEGPVITAMPFYNVIQTSVAAAIRDSEFSDTNGQVASEQIDVVFSGVQASDMTVGGAYHFKSTPDGVTWSTLTEQSDAVFTGGSGTCEGSTASDLGINHIIVPQTSSACNLVAIVIIPFVRGFDISGTDISKPKNVDVNPGAVAIDGTDATLYRGFTIVADPGSVAIDGTDATFTLGTELDAAAGSILLTGTPATIQNGRNISAEAGSILISGTETTFELGYQIVADPGSVLITGTEATLVDSGGDPTMAADPGSVKIAGPFPAFRSSAETFATNFNSVNPLVITKPAGTADGDILFAHVYRQFVSGDLGAPVGWIEIDDVIATTAMQSALFYKLAGSDEPADYSFTVSQGTERDGSAAITSWSGIDADTVLDVTYVRATHAVESTGDATPTPQPITTVSDDSVVLTIALSTTSANAAATPPTGYTQAVQVDDAAFFNSVLDYKLIPTAGVETVGDPTLPGIDGNYTRSQQYTIALKRSPAAATFARGIQFSAEAGSVAITGTPATFARGIQLVAEAHAGTVGRETASAAFGGNATNSLSVDAGTNADRFLVVHIAWFGTGQVLPAVVSYNGQALTEIITFIDGGTNQTSLWGIVNPASGSNTLDVNWAVAPVEGPVITALPFYNVDQTSVAAAVRDTAQANVGNGITTTTASLVGTRSYDMTVGGVYNFDNISTGIDFDTLTEQSDAAFTGNGGTCEGGTGTDLGINAVTVTQTKNGGIVALSLIPVVHGMLVDGSETTFVHTRVISFAADPGAVDIVGTPATFEKGIQLPADPGSVLITGTPATLTKSGTDPILAADPGSVLITGTPATLEQGYQISADSGSVAINGTEVTFELGIQLDAIAGSVVINGTPANLQYSGDSPTMLADPGSVLISGTPATLTQNYQISADPGTVLITGTPATLEPGYAISAESGSVLINGTEVTFDQVYDLAADSGSILISGTPADFNRGIQLVADAGSVLIVGTEAILLKIGDSAIAADPGSVLITGTPATLIDSGLGPRPAPPLFADPGAIFIMGTAVSLEFDGFVTWKPQDKSVNQWSTPAKSVDMWTNLQLTFLGVERYSQLTTETYDVACSTYDAVGWINLPKEIN